MALLLLGSIAVLGQLLQWQIAGIMAHYRYGNLSVGPYTSFDTQLDIELARYLARYPNFSRALQREMENYLREVSLADGGCCCHCSKCGRALDNEDGKDDYEDEEVTPARIKNAESKNKETGPPPEPDFDPARFDADLVKLHASYGGGRQRAATKKKVVQQYLRTKTTPITYLEDSIADEPEQADQIMIAARQQDFINEQLTLACTSGLIPPPDNGHTLSLAVRAGIENPVRQQRNRRYRASVGAKEIAHQPCQDKHNQLDHGHQPEPCSTSPPYHDGKYRNSQDSSAPSQPEPKVKQKTRPGDRRDSVADATPSDAQAAAIPVTDLNKSQPIVAVQVSEASKKLFLRMLGALPVNITGRSPVHFNEFVMTMLDAGFTVEHSGQCRGSGVNFKDTQCKYGGRNISFHRPHPDPKIHHHKLRTWGKRLQDKFGWSEESFQTGSSHG
ncbi:hypothetical protein AC579_6109 [Pseudocercospora musae]|uniref:Uncharacterized protein n=1 Tax=Pseudocercospora musae TaxID=113226 RepID=A0A139I1Q3_9PEZI|nr:hypothetical protein AC579_6109 [Pseudocercospora musae]